MPPHGAAPPAFTKSAGNSYHDKKLQFAKKNSAGLRVRAQPSLQSEQIGLITHEAVITYVDEVCYLFFIFGCCLSDSFTSSNWLC